MFFTVVIFGAAVYYAIKYRQKNNKHHETPAILGDHRLEAIWTIVPTIISIFIAWEGVAIYREMRAIPKNTVDINVTAKKWDWTFEYDNGKRTFGELVVPVDQPTAIVYARNGERRNATVTLASYIPREIDGGRLASLMRGTRLRELDPRVIERSGVSGVLLVEVQQGSRAWQTGLRPGDLILRVNRRDVANLDKRAVTEITGSDLKEAAAKIEVPVSAETRRLRRI